MGITRGKLAIDEHFTPVPNEWARDVRLSRRARGLLVEIMSHRVGWHVTTRSLARAGKEGRAAIQAMLVELLEVGYIRRAQSRSMAGRFSEIEYELCDPPTVAGNLIHGDGATVDQLTVDGQTVDGESDHKEDHLAEDHLQEDQGIFPARDIEPAEPTFAEFWGVWPRKEGRKAAEAAWGRAVKRVSASVIFAAAQSYASSPYRPERQFVPHGSTWLNQDRWEDPAPAPAEVRRSGASSPIERAQGVLDMGRRLQAAADEQIRGIGS